ncbi:hypothetical protein EYF80_015265 [Liparis tanakae]|uniref:Uncharacterized protein n=1 Tax=Liparis tanakae TaxID=230148 RepID=A0A4Z2IAP8_9TELE|nr:hypothetical protein EYF80_015265 [Liparis tanakae]
MDREKSMNGYEVVKACLRAAGAADVAAAFLRAALAAADAEEEDQKEASDDDEQHQSPDVSPGASTEQKYIPLSHHITSVITSSAAPRELLNSCSLSQAVVTCGVVLQYGVLAEALEPPGDQDILEVCRGGVVTAEGDGGKQGCAALQLRNIDLNTHTH